LPAAKIGEIKEFRRAAWVRAKEKLPAQAAGASRFLSAEKTFSHR
jgi:hypothetical protein